MKDDFSFLLCTSLLAFSVMIYITLNSENCVIESICLSISITYLICDKPLLLPQYRYTHKHTHTHTLKYTANHNRKEVEDVGVNICMFLKP